MDLFPDCESDDEEALPQVVGQRLPVVLHLQTSYDNKWTGETARESQIHAPFCHV